MQVYVYKATEGKRPVLFRPGRFSKVPSVFIPGLTKENLRQAVRETLDAMEQARLQPHAQVSF